ncbi:unnamed protein product [Symbiodinium sp. CCMP2456]|nr:unnamed protein product [Symbiodinium sp. CCMP2456]
MPWFSLLKMASEKRPTDASWPTYVLSGQDLAKATSPLLLVRLPFLQSEEKPVEADPPDRGDSDEDVEMKHSERARASTGEEMAGNRGSSTRKPKGVSAETSMPMVLQEYNAEDAVGCWVLPWRQLVRGRGGPQDG